MLRIISQRLHPVTQLRRMNAKSSAARAYDTPRSLTSFTASSLNSRVNFRLSMTHLLLHKTPNLVSSEPGAAHIENVIARSQSDEEQAMLRRSLVLLTYAHLEGFCKFALMAYASAI